MGITFLEGHRDTLVVSALSPLLWVMLGTLELI